MATGSAGATRAIARALVVATAGPGGDLADTIARLGHELLDAEDLGNGGTPDIAFVDFAMLERVELPPDVPTVALTEHAGTPAPNGCLATMTLAQAAASCPALLELALQLQIVNARTSQLEALVGNLQDGSAFVGRSPVIRRLQGALSRAADSDATVLIEGPAGSGKSLAARLVHCKSRRGGKSLVVVESEHTDAEQFAAALERARGSTLVFEDIDRLPAGVQQQLVRFLKERSTGKPGTQPPARIIATTKAHLPEQVARGAFREDLYYRLHNYPIVMPALRERVEDIPVLATAVLDHCATEGSGRATGFTPAALVLLESMAWPGNVAQLDAVVRRAFLAAGGGMIDREHLLGPAVQNVGSASGATPAGGAAQPAVEHELTEDDIRPFDEEEQRLLGRALRATRGNVRRAAQLLGIGRATLYRKIQQYNLRLQ